MGIKAWTCAHHKLYGSVEHYIVYLKNFVCNFNYYLVLCMPYFHYNSWIHYLFRTVCKTYNGESILAWVSNLIMIRKNGPLG